LDPIPAHALPPLLGAVRAVARAAGRRILTVYETAFDVDHKSDGSPLTAADRAAHAEIVAGLGELTPVVPIVSEESAEIDWRTRSGWRQYWLVDPLDGTREFVKRNGEFTVNIALIEDGRPVLGVVYTPVLDLEHWACEQGGAWCRRDGRELPIRARAYRGGRATVAASRSHAGPRLAVFLDRLREREGEPETISMGSALKLCLVAEGRADVYPRLGPTSEWDTAAAHCVVEVAGGSIRDLHGQPLRYNKPDVLNPWFLAWGAGDYDWLELAFGLGESET